MTKALICIASWVGGALRGENQALRDTWLTNLPKGIDYRFFIGDGTPTGEDETTLFTSFQRTDFGYAKKALASMRTPQHYTPQQDEVILHTPDDYARFAYKMRAEYRWAFEQGYDYTFSIGSDIYVDAKRLIDSGFEQHDYCGKLAGINPDYAGGGGYWLSRRALANIVDKPVTDWAEDRWVGQVMRTSGISLCADSRYATDYPALPHRDNDIISCHIGIHDGVFGTYNPEMMRAVHKNYLEE